MLSVGGGGLFCGVMEGLDEVGWSSVPVICMETVGADCFNAAVKARDLVTLPDITRYKPLSRIYSFNVQMNKRFCNSHCWLVKRRVWERKQHASRRLSTASAPRSSQRW